MRVNFSGLLYSIFGAMDSVEKNMEVSSDAFMEEKYRQLLQFIEAFRGTLFDEEFVDLLPGLGEQEQLAILQTEDLNELLHRITDNGPKEYSYDEVLCVINVFAKIIDFKSPFTSNHSLGVANRAFNMARFYGYDEETCYKLYVAGALHDVGKMAIVNDVLEKPARLTDKEYVYMQTHAYYTYRILTAVDGLEDIAEWASYHHEKLDGSGYPFGKRADELCKNARLMTCLDIYQALSEHRPYKDGMTHEQIMAIMTEMVEAGQLDGDIVKDVDKKFNPSYIISGF